MLARSRFVVLLGLAACVVAATSAGGNAPAPEFRDPEVAEVERQAFRPPLLVTQSEAEEAYATLNIPIQFSQHFTQGPRPEVAPIPGVDGGPSIPTIVGGLALSAGAMLLGLYLARRWSQPFRRAAVGGVTTLAVFACVGVAIADLPPFGNGGRPRGPVPEPEVVKAADGKTELKIVFVEKGDHVELILPKSVPIKAK